MMTGTVTANFGSGVMYIFNGAGGEELKRTFMKYFFRPISELPRPVSPEDKPLVDKVKSAIKEYNLGATGGEVAIKDYKTYDSLSLEVLISHFVEKGIHYTNGYLFQGYKKDTKDLFPYFGIDIDPLMGLILFSPYLIFAGTTNFARKKLSKKRFAFAEKKYKAAIQARKSMLLSH